MESIVRQMVVMHCRSRASSYFCYFLPGSCLRIEPDLTGWLELLASITIKKTKTNSKPNTMTNTMTSTMTNTKVNTQTNQR